jgi:hypothetical protein
MDITISKAVPLALSAYLTYKIYMCPCNTLFGCMKGQAVSLMAVIALMTVVEWPLKI